MWGIDVTDGVGDDVGQNVGEQIGAIDGDGVGFGVGGTVDAAATGSVGIVGFVGSLVGVPLVLQLDPQTLKPKLCMHLISSEIPYFNLSYLIIPCI